MAQPYILTHTPVACPSIQMDTLINDILDSSLADVINDQVTLSQGFHDIKAIYENLLVQINGINCQASINPGLESRFFRCLSTAQEHAQKSIDDRNYSLELMEYSQLFAVTFSIALVVALPLALLGLGAIILSFLAIESGCWLLFEVYRDFVDLGGLSNDTRNAFETAKDALKDFQEPSFYCNYPIYLQEVNPSPVYYAFNSQNPEQAYQQSYHPV